MICVAISKFILFVTIRTCLEICLQTGAQHVFLVCGQALAKKKRTSFLNQNSGTKTKFAVR